MAEHKRRARWRLMGAIILAGAVAAVAPFFLEEQARPLSEDLLVELPARPFSFARSDQDITPAPAAEQARQTESSDPNSLPVPAKSKEEVAAASNMPPVAEPVSPAPLAAQTQTQAQTPAVKPTAVKPAVKKPAPSPAAPAPAATASGQLMVQVGAYATAQTANRIKARLEAGGNTVVVQTTTNAQGTVRYRVRVGPFETREQAILVRDRAKAQGYDAALVRS